MLAYNRFLHSSQWLFFVNLQTSVRFCALSVGFDTTMTLYLFVVNCKRTICTTKFVTTTRLPGTLEALCLSFLSRIPTAKNEMHQSSASSTNLVPCAFDEPTSVLISDTKQHLATHVQFPAHNLARHHHVARVLDRTPQILQHPSNHRNNSTLPEPNLCSGNCRCPGFDR